MLLMAINSRLRIDLLIYQICKNLHRHIIDSVISRGQPHVSRVKVTYYILSLCYLRAHPCLALPQAFICIKKT